MKALTKYRFSANALAEAKTISDVTEACSWYDGLRKHANTIKDRAAEIGAAEFVIRAERKLGQLMKAARAANALAKGTRGTGRPKLGGIKKTRLKEPTLGNAGVDKNRANRARKLANLNSQEFNDRLDAWQDTVNNGNDRVTATLPEPPREQAEAIAAKARANNISLKEWEGLSGEERREYLQPHNFQTEAQFNKQESAGIEWAQWSWNPVTGCRHDCPYCYARDIAEQYRSTVYPHGFEPAFRPYMLNAPANTRMPDEAATDTRYKNVFTCSMADLFGRWVPGEWITAVLNTVRTSPQWNFLFLTKFPKRMAEFDIPRNAWMGTTVDLQARVANAEAAFAKLANAGIRWLSIEPMLEPIKFERLELFNWIVIGGASRSSKTPAFQPPFPWIISIYNQAKAAGCAVYMKTNLLGNRVLELPFDAPIISDPMAAPATFHYLKKREHE
jgi:protein gp37